MKDNFPTTSKNIRISFLPIPCFTIVLLLALLLNINANAQCSFGTPSHSPTDSWRGYVYKNIGNGTPSNPFIATNYVGYVDRSKIFNQDIGNGSLIAPTLCATQTDKFAIRYRMTVQLDAGTYTFKVGGDDGYRFSYNGGSTWHIDNWTEHSYTTTNITANLAAGTYNFVLDYFEQGNIARVSFDMCEPGSSPTISGPTQSCSGSSVTLTASGGLAPDGSTIEWGRGTTVGNNIIGSGNSITVSPTVTTTYWARRKANNSCNSTWNATNFHTVTLPTNATAPSITASTTICLGATITLNAIGGSAGSDSRIEWGTGIVGTNIIEGQQGTSLTVSPTTTTTYWVRRVNNQCGNVTSGASSTITVTQPNAAPTSISGASSTCANTPFTLTAEGGSPTATYQWGRGNVGSNIIAGATTRTLTTTATTGDNYWVRILNPGSCGYTSHATRWVGISAPAGDPNYSPYDEWRGYVYASIPSASPATYSDYRGYITMAEIFNNNLGQNPIQGPNVCGAYADYYMVRYKMTKWLAPGNYQMTVGGDDGYRLRVNGNVVIDRWIDQSYNTSTVVVAVNGATTFELDHYEWAGDSQVSFTYCPVSIAPTSISGPSQLCSGQTIQLTAAGGTLAAGAQYQWGTGNIVGNNPRSETGNTISVNPTANMTYWVRMTKGPNCSDYTTGVTKTIFVYPNPVQPTTISGPSSTCVGTPITLTANGTAPVGSYYEWGTGYNVGQNIITGATGSSVTVTPTTPGNTNYWVRIMGGNCPPASWTSGASRSITVNAVWPAPLAITGAETPSCPGSNVVLKATGIEDAVNAPYQWGTGSVPGQNVLGETYHTIWVQPMTTTTYWVRRVNGGSCGYTNAATVTVTVIQPSVQPTSITSSLSNVCSGGSVTLTATGGSAITGAVYQWGTGWTVGQNVIPGNTQTITVNPTSQTVYWVRTLDPAPCPTPTWTWGPTITINTTATGSTAPTSITQTGAITCPGNSVTLTAQGGTTLSGTTFEWGTGNVIGQNPISGTSSSITVSPTTTTTYWVRKKNSNAACDSYTAGVTTVVTVSGAPGNPATFGDNVWNVYGYIGSSMNLSVLRYSGYYAVSTLGFDTQNGTNNWNINNSPSASAGWQGCPIPNDNFTFVHKRRGFPCGTYEIRLPNWDDETTVFINGQQVWTCNTWSGANSCNGFIGTYQLNASSTIEVRTREIDGLANCSLTLTNTMIASTPVTSITGPATAVCPSSSVTLTAVGAILGTTGSYQWGTGNVIGSNPIPNQSGSSITVTPTVNTTYWVRTIDSQCNVTTTGRTFTVNMTPAPTSGTLQINSSAVCKNTVPGDITIVNHGGNVIRWEVSDTSTFSPMQTIASTATTLPGSEIGPITATKYVRAVVRGTCTTTSTTPILTLSLGSSATYSASGWSATPTPATSVTISQNLTLPANLTVCSCQVTGSTTLTIPAGLTLTVQGDVKVAPTGNIMVENTGSLVQVDDNADNSGTITVKRKTTPMKQYDFSYWSAPVQNFTLNQLSPATMADKFYSFNPITNQWVTHMSGNVTMTPATGYIVRAPQGWNLTNATNGVYQATFTGAPNNGVIPATIKKGATDYNLIGNPYPSAIDIDKFLLDPANQNVVKGTIYLWTHNTAISQANVGPYASNYTRDDYAKYNVTGGVLTAPASYLGAVVPNGKVASGQSFFIEANPSMIGTTNSVFFNNSMRIAGQNNQFFRMNSEAAALPSAGIEKNRIWINMKNPTGAYDEMLLGYIQGATNGIDNLYDGKTFPAGNVVGLYSINEGTNLTIQGRALPFDNTDVIPVGYTSTIAGTFTLETNNYDGLFIEQNVYLLDKTTNVFHDLKQSEYTFMTQAGTFNDRFEIHFLDPTALGTDHPYVPETDVVVIKTGRKVAVRSGQIPVKALTIFDLTGRRIYSNNTIDSNEFYTHDLNVAAQVLLVKVTLENNQQISREVIMD
ncbi:MAG: T9SS sorting signal type C domain-containing protein [Flavobacterium sp.]|nr:T9SS sorting signal type C domain-containing protein [Flavobacterium sp.]